MSLREEIELEFYSKNTNRYKRLSPEKKEQIELLKKLRDGELKNKVTKSKKFITPVNKTILIDGVEYDLNFKTDYSYIKKDTPQLINPIDEKISMGEPKEKHTHLYIKKSNIKEQKKIVETEKDKQLIKKELQEKKQKDKELKKKKKIENRKKYEFNFYREEVRKITKQQNIQSLEHYDKRLTYVDIINHGQVIYKSDTLYTLDHKISIWYGWKNEIDPELIGHISNLRYIPSVENGNKGRKCFIDDENSYILKVPRETLLPS